ncbi:unnamed protein product [Leptidea sinapis]|uniref:Uncharacterized protein n=1 Tax=Leptidea sinapis TaxID=189913 RepID=A0A5E4Q307_9NEOP|nr:unnamed protein product [Leptidea sinapis]
MPVRPIPRGFQGINSTPSLALVKASSTSFGQQRVSRELIRDSDEIIEVTLNQYADVLRNHRSHKDTKEKFDKKGFFGIALAGMANAIRVVARTPWIVVQELIIDEVKVGVKSSWDSIKTIFG